MDDKHRNLDLRFHFVHDEDGGIRACCVGRDTDMTDEEISALGERIGQSDTWQVHNWNVIQKVLGESGTDWSELV